MGSVRYAIFGRDNVGISYLLASYVSVGGVLGWIGRELFNPVFEGYGLRVERIE